LLLAAALLWAMPALAQQLLTGMTGPACAAAGGSIRTWTSTAGMRPMVGECYVPPRINRGGNAGYSGGGGSSSLGRAQGLLGAAQGFLGALRSLVPDDDEDVAADDDGAAERQQIAEMAEEANDRGIAATEAGDYDEALAEFELAAAHFESLGDDANYEIVMRNAGVAEARLEAEAEDARRERAAADAREEARRAAEAAVKREPYNCGPGPHPPDVVGCYDLGPKPPAKTPPKKNALRDDIKKKLAEKGPAPRTDEAAATASVPPAAGEKPAAAAPARPAPPRPSDAAPPPGHRRDVLTEAQCKTWKGRFFTPSGQTVPVCDYPANPAFTMQGGK